MRLIKEDTFRYESFFNLLETGNIHSASKEKNKFLNHTVREEKMNLKNDQYFLKITSLQKQFDSANDLNCVNEALSKCITELPNFFKAEIYLLDNNQQSLKPLSGTVNNAENDFFNVCLNSGIFKRIFEKDSPVIIPASAVKNKIRSNEKYLIFPLLKEKERLGILALSAGGFAFSESSDETNFIKSAISLTLNKIDSIKNREELNSTYKELQVYQSKLSNDYKLSAIGELTSGIAEDILSPLQIILGYTDFLRKENNLNNCPSLDAINSQVKKVELVVKGLIKFANINNVKYKVQPCNVNEIINEYCEMISSFLKNENYECILDFEKNIPPILSHPNEIHQLLTNIFSLLKAANSNGGGILIQTKHQKDSVIIKFISTDKIDEGKSSKENLSLKIVEKLMKNHEGNIKVTTDENFGSTAILTFPIKRKFA